MECEGIRVIWNRMQKGVSIADLPAIEKEKIAKLVQRLSEQSVAKEHYQGLYNQAMKENEEQKKTISNLNIELERLREENRFMKQKLEGSLEVLKKAREKHPCPPPQPKHLRDASSLDKSILDCPQRSGKQNTIEYSQFHALATSHQFAASPSLHRIVETQSHSSLKDTISNQQKLTRCSVAKNQNEIRDQQQSSLNLSSQNETTKKQEILSLRKEIEELTQEIKARDRKTIPYDDKLKKCEEIRQRYLSGKKKSASEESISEGESNEEEKFSATGKFTRNSKPCSFALKASDGSSAPDRNVKARKQEQKQSEWKTETKETGIAGKRIAYSKKIESFEDEEKSWKGAKKQGRNKANVGFYDDGLFDLVQELEEPK